MSITREAEVPAFIDGAPTSNLGALISSYSSCRSTATSLVVYVFVKGLNVGALTQPTILRNAYKQASAGDAMSVEIDGQKYNVVAAIGYPGATATVQKEGVEIGRAVMGSDGAIIVTSPPQDTDAHKAQAHVVYLAAMEFKRRNEAALAAANTGPTALPSTQPDAQDPNAALRAQQQAAALQQMDAANKLARRNQPAQGSDSPAGTIAVQFNDAGIVATDSKGPIAVNSDATEIKLTAA